MQNAAFNIFKIPLDNNVKINIMLLLIEYTHQTVDSRYKNKSCRGKREIVFVPSCFFAAWGFLLAKNLQEGNANVRSCNQ